MIEDRTMVPNWFSTMRNQGIQVRFSQAVVAGQALQSSPFQTGSQGDLPTPWSLFPPNTKDALAGAAWAATRVFAEAQRRERRWNVALVAMKDQIQSLSNQLKELRQEIVRLQNLRTYVVPLTTLSPTFQMTQQIPVTIEGDGESFTATFVEANISASGDTEGDALANFKDSLMSTYEVLEHIPLSQLGAVPTRQWGILQNIVRRSE